MKTERMIFGLTLLCVVICASCSKNRCDDAHELLIVGPTEGTTYGEKEKYVSLLTSNGVFIVPDSVFGGIIIERRDLNRSLQLLSNQYPNIKFSAEEGAFH